MQCPEGPCEQSRRVLAERSKTWVDWARGTVQALVPLCSFKRVSQGPAQKGPKPEIYSLHCPTIPPSSIRRRKEGLWEGAGGWRGQQGVSLISKPRVRARPKCTPASEGGGCALRLSDAPAGSQESLAEREGGKIAHVCVFKIYKRQALLKFPEPLLKFE